MKYKLHVALDQAYYDKLISSNPVDGVRLPVPDGPEQRVLRPEEKERICAHAATIHTFPAQGVILLLTCGLRRGELLGLQWQDVDLENGIIRIRHTLSRLKKFDVTKSAYQYIQLDTYAPKTNRTAIYLGPVKTKKRPEQSICRCGPQKPFLKYMRSTRTFQRECRISIPITWCSVQKKVTHWRSRSWKMGFNKFLLISRSKA